MKTSYIISACSHGLSLSCDKSSAPPSTERRHRRPSRFPDSHDPRRIVRRATERAHRIPTAGFRCGRFRLRGTALFLNIPFRGFHGLPFGLPLPMKRRQYLLVLRRQHGLFLRLVTDSVDPLSAGRRTERRRPIRVAEHLSAVLVSASTPEGFSLSHAVTPSYLVCRNGTVTPTVTAFVTAYQSCVQGCAVDRASSPACAGLCTAYSRNRTGGRFRRSISRRLRTLCLGCSRLRMRRIGYRPATDSPHSRVASVTLPSSSQTRRPLPVPELLYMARAFRSVALENGVGLFATE